MAERRQSGSQVQGGLRETDRARRVVPGNRRRARYVRPPLTTHSSPCRGFRGPPSAVRGGLLEQRAGWVVPGIAPPCTHPVYPPCLHLGSHSLRCPGAWHGARVAGACTYGRFWTRVGEPRGSRTHSGYGSQTGYIQLLRFREVHTAV